MILYYLLFFIFLYGLIKNYKNTILIYIPLRVVLHQGIVLWPSNPTLMFDAAACFFILLLYFGNRGYTQKGKFPFTIPLAIFIISEFCSSFLSNTRGNFLNFTQNVIIGVSFIYILWQVINSAEDIKKIIKGYSIIFTIAVLLSVLEQFTHYNPVIALERMLLPTAAPRGLIWESHQVRFGIFRAQAFMSISITYGAYCLLFFLFYFGFSLRHTWANYYNTVKQNIFKVMLCLGIFLSGSKAPILSLLIGFLPYIRFKWIKNIKLWIILIVLVPLSGSLLNRMYRDISDSITVGESYEYTGGSSLAMRKTQLAISYKYFQQAPVIGNGTKFLSTVRQADPEILGAESIWFGLLIENGSLGILAYIILLIYPLLKRRQGSKKTQWALFLSFITVNTMTTVPGLNFTFYYTLMILIMKSQMIEQSVEKKQIQQEI